MKYLITGGCGFLGSNLACEVLKRGDELFVFDNLYRVGSVSNLKWLESLGSFKFYHSDIRSNNDIENCIKDCKPDVIFHLAGQVAMTTSINDPRLDFEINAIGTFNLLDAVRKYAPYASVLFSSSNKVYGDFKKLNFIEKETRYECIEFPSGFSEDLPLDFQSPYGCSKGTADQYLLDFNRIYDINTIVFRHSSMYGGNQYSTIDQGWIGWFCQKALEIKSGKSREPFTISGTGKQVRDVLHADDVVKLYFKSADNIKLLSGQAFNIGGGVDFSLSLIELFSLLEKILDIKMKYHQLKARQSDQLVFIADGKKIFNTIGWKPKVTVEKGIDKMINWFQELL